MCFGRLDSAYVLGAFWIRIIMLQTFIKYFTLHNLTDFGRGKRILNKSVRVCFENKVICKNWKIHLQPILLLRLGKLYDTKDIIIFVLKTIQVTLPLFLWRVLEVLDDNLFAEQSVCWWISEISRLLRKFKKWP